MGCFNKAHCKYGNTTTPHSALFHTYVKHRFLHAVADSLLYVSSSMRGVAPPPSLPQ